MDEIERRGRITQLGVVAEVIKRSASLECIRIQNAHNNKNKYQSFFHYPSNSNVRTLRYLSFLIADDIWLPFLSSLKED